MDMIVSRNVVDAVQSPHHDAGTMSFDLSRMVDVVVCDEIADNLGK